MSKVLELAQTYQEVLEAFGDFELTEESKVKLALSLFIGENQNKPKQWPAKTGTATSPIGADGAQRTVTGLLTNKRKEDKVNKKGKPYTRFCYTIGGVEYNTISKELSAELSKATVGKSQIEVILTKEGNFENMTSASVIPLESAGSREEDGDDIPF